MNGYISVDCKGMNLLASESQTITGIYADCIAAINTGKPIYADNCEYGEGVPMTPISVMAIIEDGTIIFTASILQIRINSEDAVTIVSLLPTQATRKTTK